MVVFVGALPPDAAKRSLGVTRAARRGQMLPEGVAEITRYFASGCGEGVPPHLLLSSFVCWGWISFSRRDWQVCWANAPHVPGEPPRRTPLPPRSLRAIPPFPCRAPSFPWTGTRLGAISLKRQPLTAHGREQKCRFDTARRPHVTNNPPDMFGPQTAGAFETPRALHLGESGCISRSRRDGNSRLEAVWVELSSMRTRFRLGAHACFGTHGHSKRSGWPRENPVHHRSLQGVLAAAVGLCAN
ncbi:uncharacterized protein Tco025E_08493 [Trypanosoma conorhini]|uniref:Uncharacterized protein n=1 Tax=Trypanosoma conorhini TaxID=83891 RepID=A0A3R7NG05_9TRYP|nr:uncharacterized protein Tco025E_08493 [Trypanosoma conorhini]RNF02157.1 hypothetical protein Tco025E_08493 [Trypanosoma conorhini]